MIKLFYKELRLILTPALYLYTAMTLFMLVPIFPPITNMAYSLIGLITVLNVALGERDLEFTALLPVPRRYIVLSKCFDLVYSQILQLVVALPIALLIIYVIAPDGHGSGQNTNSFFLAMVLINYSIFNLIFLPWFFKTAEKVNKPLLTGLLIYFIMAVIYGIILYFVPVLNGVGEEGLNLRLLILATSILLYIVLTFISYKLAVKNFERVSI